MREGLPLYWVESSGWIIMSGSADPLSEIRARALSRHDVGGAIAYVSLSDDMGDALMDDMAELGAPSGYLVDLSEQDNNEIYERLSAAGMIVIAADIVSDRLSQLVTHTVAHALKEALNLGAVILFEGAASAIAGEYIVSAEEEIRAGLKLVGNAILLPDVGSIAESKRATTARRHLPEATFIGLEAGAALVLGPDQQIETWGPGQVTIGLGDPRHEPRLHERDIATE